MERRIITTNPSAASVIPNTEYTSTLKQYLEIKKTNVHGEESILKVEPGDGKVYDITFYDSATAGYISAVCIISEIYEPFIRIKYITGLDRICPCTYKDILIKFIDCKETTVNIESINNISEYIIEKPKKYKEVSKVALLGITSELIQSIVVRLRLYDDGGCCDITGATIVDMKVGGHYQVDYVSHEDHCMYQICGILKSITVRPEYGDETSTTGFIRREHTGTCCHHNQVGMGDTVYDDYKDTEEYFNSEHFLSLAKDKPENIMFVFDTSTEFNSTIDAVMLTDIRNVEMMEDVDCEIKDPEYPPTESLPPLPDCFGKCCGHCNCDSCNNHGNCCCHVMCPSTPSTPPSDSCDCDDKVVVEDWEFYIDNKTCTATGANKTTGEVVHSMSMKDLLEFYVHHS